MPILRLRSKRSATCTLGRSPTTRWSCAWTRKPVCSPGRGGADPGGTTWRPVLVEHEYGRDGALNLFAAFDTRTGKVCALTAERKRQEEFIGFLEQLDREIPATITKIHVVLDNLRMHKGKQVQAWLSSIRGSCSTIRRCIARG